jgi:hypothetical protein
MHLDKGVAEEPSSSYTAHDDEAVTATGQGGVDSWAAAVAAAERATQQQVASIARSGYRSWRSAEVSRLPPPPPPPPQQQLQSESELGACAAGTDVGQQADALRGYRGWSNRMGQVFSSTEPYSASRGSWGDSAGAGASGGADRTAAAYDHKMRQLFAAPDGNAMTTAAAASS